MDRRDLLASTAMLFGAAIVPPIATAQDDESTLAVSYPQSLIDDLVDCKKAAVNLHQFAIGNSLMTACARSSSTVITLVDAMLELVAEASGYGRAIAQTAANACAECAMQCSRHSQMFWYAELCRRACIAAEWELRRV